MNTNTILCPNCQTSISIDEVMTHQIEDRIKQETERALEKKFQLERDVDRKKMLDWQAEQSKKLILEAEKNASSKIENELKLLRDENDKKAKELEESRKMEIKLRQEKQTLDAEKQKFELEKLKTMEEMGTKLREEMEKNFSEKFSMREKEKDKQIDDMKKKIDELQIKASVTSQQLQGEVQELEIESRLRAEFPMDEILEVGKGVKGADIIQKVYDSGKGRQAGVIVWESKRTYKNWDKEWIGKLKQDSIKVKADAMVIVSNILPEGIHNFALKDGVLVSNFECFLMLASILRTQIIKQNDLIVSNSGKDLRMEGLYNYLRSEQFASHIRSLAEGWDQMRKQIDDERRALERQWSAREKMLERVMSNTMGLYGEISGLMGSSLPEIDSLSVNALGLHEPEKLVEDQQKLVEE